MRDKGRSDDVILKIYVDATVNQLKRCSQAPPARRIPSGYDGPARSDGSGDGNEAEQIDNKSESLFQGSSDCSYLRALRASCARARAAAKPMPKRSPLVSVTKIRSFSNDSNEHEQHLRWERCRERDENNDCEARRSHGGFRTQGLHGIHYSDARPIASMIGCTEYGRDLHDTIPSGVCLQASRQVTHVCIADIDHTNRGPPNSLPERRHDDKEDCPAGKGVTKFECHRILTSMLTTDMPCVLVPNILNWCCEACHERQRHVDMSKANCMC